jgi:hypothetical protein
MSRAAAWPAGEGPFPAHVLDLAQQLYAAIERRVDELGPPPRPDVLCAHCGARSGPRALVSPARSSDTDILARGRRQARCAGSRYRRAPPVGVGNSRVARVRTSTPILARSTVSTAPTLGGGSHSRLAVRRRPLMLICSNSRLPRRSTPSSTPSSGTASRDLENSTHRGGHPAALLGRRLRSPSFNGFAFQVGRFVRSLDG